MQILRKQLSDTRVQLSIDADETQLNGAKRFVLQRVNVKVPGFRAGKAPLHLVEKYADQARLQTDFLDAAINDMYSKTIEREKIRPVSTPDVTIKKFVPFTTLEIDVSVDVIGPIKLADYKSIRLQKEPVTVGAADVKEVLETLQGRIAKREEKKQAIAKGDEVVLDFDGSDTKTGEAIQGAQGKDYPLTIGSGTFIPGFEDHLIGLKPGDNKSFSIIFPADYGVKALQKRDVTFDVRINKVFSLTLPKLDDDFAAQAGPFKTLADLKADIKKQLTVEREEQAARNFENTLIEKIVEQSTITPPASLVEQEIDRMENDERQNLTYRGQTWQEHLKDEGVTEAEHREQKRAVASNRVKAGLLLSEIAEQENITVTPEDLEIRMQLLKGQYKDKLMQAELDKPENQKDILSRMVTEKTVLRLVSLASKG